MQVPTNRFLRDWRLPAARRSSESSARHQLAVQERQPPVEDNHQARLDETDSTRLRKQTVRQLYSAEYVIFVSPQASQRLETPLVFGTALTGIPVEIIQSKLVMKSAP